MNVLVYIALDHHGAVGGVNNDLFLVHSVIETSAILLLIVLRMLGAYDGYRTVRQTLGQIDAEGGVVGTSLAHVRLVRRWMLVVMAIAVGIAAMCVASFAAMFFYESLDWTILSNNVGFIAVTGLSILYRARACEPPTHDEYRSMDGRTTRRVVSILYRERVTLAVSRIHDDLHKVLGRFETQSRLNANV